MKGSFCFPVLFVASLFSPGFLMAISPSQELPNLVPAMKVEVGSHGIFDFKVDPANPEVAVTDIVIRFHVKVPQGAQYAGLIEVDEEGYYVSQRYDRFFLSVPFSRSMAPEGTADKVQTVEYRFRKELKDSTIGEATQWNDEKVTIDLNIQDRRAPVSLTLDFKTKSILVKSSFTVPDAALVGQAVTNFPARERRRLVQRSLPVVERIKIGPPKNPYDCGDGFYENQGKPGVIHGDYWCNLYRLPATASEFKRLSDDTCVFFAPVTLSEAPLSGVIRIPYSDRDFDHLINRYVLPRPKDANTAKERVVAFGPARLFKKGGSKTSYLLPYTIEKKGKTTFMQEPHQHGGRFGHVEGLGFNKDESHFDYPGQNFSLSLLREKVCY